MNFDDINNPIDEIKKKITLMNSSDNRTNDNIIHDNNVPTQDNNKNNILSDTFNINVDAKDIPTYKLQKVLNKSNEQEQKQYKSLINKYCKNLIEPATLFFKENFANPQDKAILIPLGWIELENDIKVLYEIQHVPMECQSDEYFNLGFGDGYVVKYLLGTEGDPKYQHYEWCDINDVRELYSNNNFHIVNEIEIDTDDTEFLAESEFGDFTCSLYSDRTNKTYFAWIECINEEIKKKVSHAEVNVVYSKYFKKHKKINHKKIAYEIGKFEEWQKYQINKKIDKITLLLLLILCIYPAINLILKLCSFVLPIFLHNITTDTVNNFITKYLPYGFHPNVHVMLFLLFNILCMVFFYHIWKLRYKDDLFLYLFRGVTALICFIALFNATIFDALAGTSILSYITFYFLNNLIKNKKNKYYSYKIKVKLLIINIILIAPILAAIFIPNKFYPIQNKFILVIVLLYAIYRGLFCKNY